MGSGDRLRLPWLCFALVTALVIGSGCARSPAVPVDVQPSAAVSTDGSATACGGAELVGPGGRVDLTGTWEGSSTVWFVTQSGSCVTIEGLSRFADQRDGDQYRFVFSGDLSPDFTIRGRWMWTWACNGPACQVQGRTKDVELQVGFAADGEASIEVPSDAMGMEAIFTVVLERTSQGTKFPQ